MNDKLDLKEIFIVQYLASFSSIILSFVLHCFISRRVVKIDILNHFFAFRNVGKSFKSIYYITNLLHIMYTYVEFQFIKFREKFSINLELFQFSAIFQLYS